jgi:hypothetical protein
MVSKSMSTETTESPYREHSILKLALSAIVLAIPALLWNRALLPALPGSRSGIERVFDYLALFGGVLSQLLAIVLVLLLLKLVVSSLGTFAIGLMGRLIVLPIGSAVSFLLIASTVGPLEPEMDLLLAALGVGALVSCLSPALRHPTLRAAGLLLLLTAVASLTYSIGRFLALKASLEALPHEYFVARALTTVGLVFDALSLLWVSIWLSLSRKRALLGTKLATDPTYERVTTQARIAIAFAIAVTCALLAHRGQASTASFFEVVLGRAISALAREPSPLVFVTVSPTLDLFALLLTIVLLTRPAHVAPSCRWAMALILLGRCAADIPTHCALMTAGALLLIWYSPSAVKPIEASTNPVESTPLQTS